MITNIIIRLMIAHIDALTIREHELNCRIATAAGTTHGCYLAHRRDAIAAERATFEAMLRVYLAAGTNQQQRRRAA